MDPRVDITTLQRVPLFRDLPIADLAAIVNAAHLRTLKTCAVLLRQGEPARSFYVIMRGRLSVGQVTPAGNKATLRLLSPGHMVGGPALFGDATYPVTATAIEPSAVLCWTAASISLLVSRHPQLARNIMRTMAQRIVELQNRCLELTTESVDRRLARALLRLAEQTGKPVPGGILLAARLSRQDLSEMAGTTLFTVSRILNGWSRDGLVEVGRQKVILRRPHQLRCIAEDRRAASEG